MKLSELTARVQRQLPQTTGNDFDTTVITAELNNACDEINLMCQVLKNYKDISLTANVQLYNFSIFVSEMLGITKNGIWYINSSGYSKYLYPKSMRWLDLYIRNWRDQAAGEPQYYWIDGDQFGLYPKPDLSTASYPSLKARIHYIEKSTPMDNADHYPWKNQTNELSIMRPFDKALVNYAVWKLAPAVRDKEGRDLNKQEFFDTLKMAVRQVKRRGDLTSDYDYFIRPDISGTLNIR